MPSTSKIYRQGRQFEYRVAAYFKTRGWVVLRSAGSHSPVDLICAKGGEIRVIQCKASDGYLSAVERESIQAVAAEFGASAWKAYKSPGGHIILEEVK